MTDFSDLVEAYKREVALPGAFTTTFPTINDGEIESSLSDAFAEAQLDGFFRKVTLDPDSNTTDPDLSVAGAALVVIYAGMRVLRQQLHAASSSLRAKAGPVEYETTQSASVLAGLLNEMRARKKELLDNAMRGGGTAVFQLEGYKPRGSGFYGSMFGYEFSNWSL